MAAEIADQDQKPQSPALDDGSIGASNGNGNDASAAPASGSEGPRGVKRSRIAADDDDDDDDKPGRERRKIEIKFIQDKSRRHITFSKRKAGIMKKVSLVVNLFRLRWIIVMRGSIFY